MLYPDRKGLEGLGVVKVCKRIQTIEKAELSKNVNDMKILERVKKTELNWTEWIVKLFIVFIVVVPIVIIGGALLGLTADKASGCTPLFLILGIIVGSVLSFLATLYVIAFGHKSK